MPPTASYFLKFQETVTNDDNNGLDVSDCVSVITICTPVDVPFTRGRQDFSDFKQAFDLDMKDAYHEDKWRKLF